MDAETRAYFDGMRDESRRDLARAMATMREESRHDLAQAMAAMREESRHDLAQAMAAMREESRHDLAQAMAAMREEGRRDVAAVIATLRAEMRAEGAETRRHFDVVAEGLRGDIRLVAEGVILNTEAIERLRSDISREMDERFAVVHLAFADVRREIADLRARS